MKKIGFIALLFFNIAAHSYSDVAEFSCEDFAKSYSMPLEKRFAGMKFEDTLTHELAQVEQKYQGKDELETIKNITKKNIELQFKAVLPQDKIDRQLMIAKSYDTAYNSCKDVEKYNRAMGVLKEHAKTK